MKLKLLCALPLSLSLLTLSVSLSAAESSKGSAVPTVPVNPAFFSKEGLTAEITQAKHTLADGTMALCYVIKTQSKPHEHEMGPWSPKFVTDDKDKGGIWFKDGQVYDVDGAFVAKIAEFYGDSAWNLVREDGSIRVTSTKEAFEAAARPDVDPRYHNHVVEGRPEWISKGETTFIIPVNPVYHERPTRIRRGAVGIALNGVNFDSPAPLHAILAAHTLAPLDDSGGHINPHAGYHYHAATGHTKEIAQSDSHAPMIGYALDGFGIFAWRDAAGEVPSDLDECRGHSDGIRGYHYHAGPVGENEIIPSFRGTPGYMRSAH
jgi:hypothetical protein